MESYSEQRYGRLLETLDEYLTQDFGDGNNGFDVLHTDMIRAITEMKVYPEICLGNINNFKKLIT